MTVGFCQQSAVRNAGIGSPSEEGRWAVDRLLLEGDMQVLLGGSWTNLALMMLGDGHARPTTQEDGSQWDWGMQTVPLLNPNIPK